MNPRKTLVILSLGILTFGACKKDKSGVDETVAPPEVTQITYNGASFTIEKGREWTYKLTRYPSHNTFAYFMGNGTAFNQSGDYALGPNDPPISLFFFLSLPSSSGYMAGDFLYHPLATNWYLTGLPESVKDKQVFTDAVVGFDANNDRKISPEEVIEVTGGVINFHGRSNMQFNLTLANGKTVTGRIKASMVTTNPSA